MKQVDIGPSHQCTFKAMENIKSYLPQPTAHRKIKMKLIYTPSNSKDTFIFEGDNDDIASIVNALAPAVKPTSKLNVVSNAVKQQSDNNVTKLTSNFKQEMAFLKSIYLFAPNPKTDSGRGAYVAKQILDSKTVNIAALTKKAKCTRDTILKVVSRMRSAGAEINVTDTSVVLVSLPDGPYTPKKYTRTSTASVKQNDSKFTSIKTV